MPEPIYVNPELVDKEPEFVREVIDDIFTLIITDKWYVQGNLGVWYICPGCKNIHEYLFRSNEWVTAENLHE